MEYLKEFLTSMTSYPIFISFLAGIMGEDYLFFIAILSGSGFLSLWKVIIFGLIGIFIHDIALYLIFKKYHSEKLKERLDKKSAKRGIDKWIVSWIDKNSYFWPFVVSKFVFGARILTIFYIALKEKSIKKYLLIEVLAVAIWFVIMIPLGWLVGKGFVQILNYAKGLERILVVIFIIMIIYYVINKIFKKELVQNKKRTSNKVSLN